MILAPKVPSLQVMSPLNRLEAVTQAERKQLEFVRADLDAARTFLQMADFECDAGDGEAGAQSIEKAEYSVEAAAHFFTQLQIADESLVEEIEQRIDELVREIRRVRDSREI